MNDIEIIKQVIYTEQGEKMSYIDIDNVIDNECENFIQAIENLIQRNKDLEEIEKEHKEENGRLRDRINKTINKLNEDISDDNCMWVNNQEKIVTAAKTIIDRSNYAKEILELLEESEK